MFVHKMIFPNGMNISFECKEEDPYIALRENGQLEFWKENPDIVVCVTEGRLNSFSEEINTKKGGVKGFG